MDAEPVLDNSGKQPLKVPGYGTLPIFYEIPREKRFLHGANEWNQPRCTVRELAMLRVMDALTDKPDWTAKIKDDTIVDKWRTEALGMPNMSEQAFEWCLLELRDKAASYQENNYITTLETGSRCVKSDTLVPETLRQELISLTQPLLDNPKKDWHPNSNDQVLNLVHPSLYPLVYGRTLVMPTGQVDLLTALHYCGKGETSGWDATGKVSSPFSGKFQWLPCEVKFTGKENDVKITSCINNLHPNKHRGLYHAIEKLISLSIKPWNDVLLDGDWKHHNGRVPPRIKTFGAEFDIPEEPEWISKLPYDADETKPGYEDMLNQVKEYLKLPDDTDIAAHDDGDFERDEWVAEFPDGEQWKEEMGLQGVAEWKYKRIRKLIHPEPGVAYSYADWKQGQTEGAVVPSYDDATGVDEHTYYTIDLASKFQQQGLQVIVKIVSIELTPANPRYPGGSWHIEGMLNEHIVATSIYYTSLSNTTPSRIRFRQEATLDDMDIQYPQDEHTPLCQIFGTDSLRDEPAVQELGSVATSQGRLLAFPNTLQHCVEPFELEDKSRPGHRRMVVLWLVDPHYRVASTANVAPQQYEWCAEAQVQMGRVHERLPQELADYVFEEVARDLMREEEAKELRLELMAERTVGMERVNQNIEQYNFCEH